MRSVNIIGAGRVGRTLMRLLRALPDVRIGDVSSGSVQGARKAVAEIGAGRPASAVSDMAPADLWLLTVPDDRIAAVAATLAASPAIPPAIAVHFSGFLASDLLAPLGARGWKVASCHPVRSFAEPALAARDFPGTYCGIEGDAAAVAVLRGLVADLGGIPFAVDPARKALYHAAAVFSNNFTVVLQAIATEAFLAAGVDPEVAAKLCATLLRGTAENVARLGPAAALTGPAARGDTAVLRLQQAAVADWHEDAAEIYRIMSLVARRLAGKGTTLPGEDTAGAPR